MQLVLQWDIINDGPVSLRLLAPTPGECEACRMKLLRILPALSHAANIRLENGALRLDYTYLGETFDVEIGLLSGPG